MNVSAVLDVLGSLLILLAVLMLVPDLVAAIYKEPAGVMALRYDISYYHIFRPNYETLRPEGRCNA